GSRNPHRLQYVLSEKSSLTKINIRFAYGAGNIRVACQMNDDTVTCHCLGQLGKIFDITPKYLKTRVVQMVLKMPLPARREVIENRNLLDTRIREEVVHEMAPDETRATDNEILIQSQTALRIAINQGRSRSVNNSLHKTKMELSPCLYGALLYDVE